MCLIKNEQDQLNKKTDQIGKLIRINAVAELTGLSKSYIYQLCDDDLFPKSIKLIPGGSSVAWVESEILSWIDSRIEARNRESNSLDTYDCCEENGDILSPSVDQEGV